MPPEFGKPLFLLAGQNEKTNYTIGFDDLGWRSSFLLSFLVAGNRTGKERSGIRNAISVIS